MIKLTASIIIYRTGRRKVKVKDTSHLIEFTENIRPAFTLCSLNNYNDEIALFIPTLENMADDVFLMVAVFVLQKMLQYSV